MAEVKIQSKGHGRSSARRDGRVRPLQTKGHGTLGATVLTPLSPDSLETQGVLRVIEQKQYLTHKSGMGDPGEEGSLPEDDSAENTYQG